MALAERIKIPEFKAKPSVIPPQLLSEFFEDNEQWKMRSGIPKHKKIIPKFINIVFCQIWNSVFL